VQIACGRGSESNAGFHGHLIHPQITRIVADEKQKERVLEHFANSSDFVAMAFHFKKKEPVVKAVRRLCRERIDDALESLKARDCLKSVGNVRKEIKKLRAILRLVRGEIGKGVYRENTKALRVAANRLTALRDAHVKLNAFEALAKHFKRKLPSQPFPKIKKVLRRNYRAEESRFLKSNSAAAVARILRKMKRSVDDLKIESDGWAAIGPGVKEGYRRGRAAYGTVLKKSSPENFHEWRKQVKNLGYYLRMSCKIRPEETGAATDGLEKLGEFLGDDHDLVMLKEFLGEQFKRRKETEALDKLICSRQKELRSAALKLGARFYSEKPDVFCRRLGNYWRLWRKK
jgi:CHAD domain-containing protein